MGAFVSRGDLFLKNIASQRSPRGGVQVLEQVRQDQLGPQSGQTVENLLLFFFVSSEQDFHSDGLHDEDESVDVLVMQPLLDGRFGGPFPVVSFDVNPICELNAQ